VDFLNQSEVRIERLVSRQAAYIHASGDSPEEEALTKIIVWAKTKNIAHNRGIHLMGRNTYPTEKPDPHGYEYYLTLNEPIFKDEEEIKMKNFPGGLFAVLRFKNLFDMQASWISLMKWVKENNYQEIGVIKTENGWVNSGFEELLNWDETKPPTEWVFDLWLQIKEKTLQ